MTARIMVVDDEAVTGRLLVHQLQALGYTATYLQDGLQALQRVLIEQPDLILLDVVMPHLSGWEVCREIRACSAVPIIMVTGKDADDDIAAGLAAGADDYVVKPFTMTQLNARIGAVLRRSQKPWASTTHQSTTVRPLAAVRTTTSEGLRSAPVATSVLELTPVPAVPKLQEYQTPIVVAQTAAPSEPISERRLGTRLAHARQARGMSLYQAERLCQIRWDYLQAIEQENWEYLPRQQIRNALEAYSRLLRIETHEIQGRHGSSILQLDQYQQLVVVLAALLVVTLITVLVLLTRM